MIQIRELGTTKPQEDIMKRGIWNRMGVGTLLLACGVFTASVAQAQVEGSGGYFGLSAGQVMVQDYCDSEPGLTITSCDDKDTGYRIFGGYKFNKNFAVEGGYVNLGNYPASGIFLSTPFSIDVEISGLTAQAVGMVPMGDFFTFIGRAGVIFWSLDSSAQVFGFTGSASDDGVDLALGVGGQFNFTRNVGLRADLDLYPSLGSDDTGEADVTMVSVGLVFSF